MPLSDATQMFHLREFPSESYPDCAIYIDALCEIPPPHHPQEILSTLVGSHPLDHDYDTWRNEMLSLSLGSQFPPDVQIHSSGMEYERNDRRSSLLARNVLNSKYLNAAKQLLDEIVNVRRALRERNERKRNLSSSSASNLREPSDGNSYVEISLSERQEVQNKLGKLLSMLEQVDRRYKQYYHQMQIVVSSFDGTAGYGSAKPYTALALQTISRHFRCLRDAITGQIQAARKSLGERDTCESSRGIGISRLRYVDHQLSQQKALQQLGMMHQQTWRPHRGLPESSVLILRAWLFEHFLHPYPKDSDKIMLARQTGLSRSQVSNWFINARVRLWKPMVEEMYREETVDVEIDSNSSSNASKGIGLDERGRDAQQNSPSTVNRGSFDRMHNSRISEFIENEYGVVELRGKQMPNIDGYGLYHEMSEELVSFGNGVSLTLGLQGDQKGWG